MSTWVLVSTVLVSTAPQKASVPGTKNLARSCPHDPITAANLESWPSPPLSRVRASTEVIYANTSMTVYQRSHDRAKTTSKDTDLEGWNTSHRK
jgi:hypothetical protein